MKVKILKRPKDFLINYMHEKDIHALRYRILEFFVHTYSNIIVYIDTNNRIKNLPIDNIKSEIESCGLSFNIVPTEKAQKQLFNIGKLFKSSEDKIMSESIILINMNDGTSLKDLYDHFLMYYDYGLGVSDSKSIQEWHPLLQHDASGILFNKELLSVSLYDSILFCRTRTDAPYSDFEQFLNTL